MTRACGEQIGLSISHGGGAWQGSAAENSHTVAECMPVLVIMDRAECSASAPADDFGGFDDFAAPAPASTPASGFDDFGDFGEPSAAPVPAPAADFG
jgi:hypothetical protein